MFAFYYSLVINPFKKKKKVLDINEIIKQLTSNICSREQLGNLDSSKQKPNSYYRVNVVYIQVNYSQSSKKGKWQINTRFYLNLNECRNSASALSRSSKNSLTFQYRCTNFLKVITFHTHTKKMDVKGWNLDINLVCLYKQDI